MTDRMTARPILAGRGLLQRYGGRTVLDLESVELRPGELLAVLGPNGAGKSTLLRLLAMLEKPTRGTVTYRSQTGRTAERALRSRSAVVFQRPHFWRDTVTYNVGLGLRLRRISQSETTRRVAGVCELLGIDALLRTPIATLSGGEAQRVALARALVLDPDVLFLDEPTASLDSEARSDLRADLERVARQRATSILLITHDRNEAFHLADRIAVLRDGRLVQTGTPTDLYEDPADPFIARMTGAELTIRGRVVAADDRMLTVDVAGTRLFTVGRVPVGASAKIAYRPEDLVLTPASAPVGESSTRNILYATVRERRDMGGLVRLRLSGPVELVALLTRSAAEQLSLAAGARVSVRVKATALHTYPTAPEPSEDGAPDPAEEGAAEPGGEDAPAEPPG